PHRERLAIPSLRASRPTGRRSARNARGRSLTRQTTTRSARWRRGAWPTRFVVELRRPTVTPLRPAGLGAHRGPLQGYCFAGRRGIIRAARRVPFVALADPVCHGHVARTAARAQHPPPMAGHVEARCECFATLRERSRRS